MYHLKQDWKRTLEMPIKLRKGVIEKYIQQKEREEEAIERAKKKSRR